MNQLLVRHLMTEDVFALGPHETLATLRDLMMERQVRHMPVVDGGRRLVGLVSQRDLLRNALVEQARVSEAREDAVLRRLRVEDLMTPHVESVGPDTDIRQAAQLLIENRFGCLPVVNGSRQLVGILTESDFVRLMAQGD